MHKIRWDNQTVIEERNKGKKGIHRVIWTLAVGGSGRLSYLCSGPRVRVVFLLRDSRR